MSVVVHEELAGIESAARRGGLDEGSCGLDVQRDVELKVELHVSRNREANYTGRTYSVREIIIQKYDSNHCSPSSSCGTNISLSFII